MSKKKNNCKVFLTLNIILLEAEIPALISLLNSIVNSGLDGVIVQYFGLLYLLNENFKSLKKHVSAVSATLSTCRQDQRGQAFGNIPWQQGLIVFYSSTLASAPYGVPENSQFFLPTTKGRILFSAMLLSMERLPSSM